MTEKPTNVPASVRQRLLNRARAEGRVFQELATLYAMERFLYRLAASDEVDRFVLKGGLMTLTWAGEFARVTRDIDLLRSGSATPEAVVEAIRAVLLATVGDDGVVFDAASAIGEAITVDAAYMGTRVRFTADLAGMVLHLQTDVGVGDAVVPAPQWVEYPQLLDFGSPRLLGYPPEATIAEKLHAVCYLGLANSRLKDYYDFWTAARTGVCTPKSLGLAIRHTFARREQPLPTDLPEGLSPAFADSAEKRAQWAGFLRKSRLTAPPLDEVVRVAAELARPAFEIARTRSKTEES